MAIAPKRPCKRCRQATLNPSGYCDACEVKRKKTGAIVDRRRGTSAQRGYTSRWRKLRGSFIAQNPLCAECQRMGKIKPATDVDHIIPHRGDEKLFYDWANLQALCHKCHSRKTAKEDGGFGNDPRRGGGGAKSSRPFSRKPGGQPFSRCAVLKAGGVNHD